MLWPLRAIHEPIEESFRQEHVVAPPELEVTECGAHRAGTGEHEQQFVPAGIDVISRIFVGWLAGAEHQIRVEQQRCRCAAGVTSERELRRAIVPAPQVPCGRSIPWLACAE